MLLLLWRERWPVACSYQVRNLCAPTALKSINNSTDNKRNIYIHVIVKCDVNINCQLCRTLLLWTQTPGEIEYARELLQDWSLLIVTINLFFFFFRSCPNYTKILYNWSDTSLKLEGNSVQLLSYYLQLKGGKSLHVYTDNYRTGTFARDDVRHRAPSLLTNLRSSSPFFLKTTSRCSLVVNPGCRVSQILRLGLRTGSGSDVL